MFTSMVIVFFIGPLIIKFFSSKKIHNPIRSDGPTDHIIKKIGTPTMGGVMILIGIFSGTLLWGDLNNSYNWFLIFIVGIFYLKVPQKINNSLNTEMVNIDEMENSGINNSEFGNELSVFGPKAPWGPMLFLRIWT